MAIIISIKKENGRILTHFFFFFFFLMRSNSFLFFFSFLINSLRELFIDLKQCSYLLHHSEFGFL